jgi:hypothetical protein
MEKKSPVSNCASIDTFFGGKSGGNLKKIFSHSYFKIRTKCNILCSFRIMNFAAASHNNKRLAQ